ncbi:MAG: hypothetical protein K9M96_09605 [Deltaproteobacteria bacterium]|nr:hypothetical protein [Deltaproteobacteria bacterium]
MHKKGFIGVRSVVLSVMATCLLSLMVACGGGGDGGGPGASASITLAADPTTISADGTSSSIITATVKDSSGNPVPHFTDVTFTTTLGHFTNGGTTITKETQPPLDNEGKVDLDADPTGIVEVSLLAGVTPGTAKVTASSYGVTQSVSIILTHAGNTGVPVAEEFSLAAAYVNISGWWVAGLEDAVTASVGDIYGNAVQDDTIIRFKTYNTGGYFGQDQVPTQSGKATSNLYSSASPAPSEGFLMLTGETTGDATTRVTAITAVPYPDHHIMYAGTNGGGVYKSTDSGTTWTTVSRSSENPKRGQNLIHPYVKGHSGIAVDPDNHNAVYVGTGYLGEGNLYRSLDGGMNWNSNNTEEWNGVYDTTAAVLTVLCDGDDRASTDYPYVWIGTEGKGPLYAVDGETFQPSGSYASSPVAGSGNTGNGTMSHPAVSYTSVTETWTAEYVETNGTATLPQADAGNTGDGTMSSITTSTTTETEDWTVTYKAVAGDVTFDGTGNGSVRNISLTEPNAATETWTLECTAASGEFSGVTGTATDKGELTPISVTGGPKEEKFIVSCTSGGDIAEFNVESEQRGLSTDTVTSDGTVTDVKFSVGGTLKLAISAATDTFAGPYDIGDFFIFTVTTGGTFSVKSSVAGFYPDATVGESYSEDGLSFIITQGTTAFVVGDKFTFTTTAGWQVSGTVSGIQSNTATTGTAYTSDNGEVGFTITAGGVPFAVNDKFTFSTTAGDAYWTVTGSESGLQTNLAFNGKGYYSDGLEVYFVITEGSTPFADGDTFTFTVTATQVGHGWTVWDMVRVPDTHGSGAVLYCGTATGVYKSSNGGRTWDSTNLFTGDYVIALALYPSATGGTNDILYAGTQNGGVWVSTNSGTTWTQYATGMDSGKGATIKDLLLDPANDKLYAITYSGSGESATGDVYVHSLDTDGTMTSGGWTKINSGLSGYALYALASDTPSDPGAVFAGGQGINLYKATSTLDTGNLSWSESKSGLSNLIMARLPILFSGECTLSVTQHRNETTNTVYFTVYIEDVNGNPPVSGSTFTVTYKPETGDEVTIYDITYGDSYTHTGTFRDPADPSTNLPYSFSITVSSGDEVEIAYTPANTLPNVPGSSGSAVTRTYAY